jgi:hypothetical protein
MITTEMPPTVVIPLPFNPASKGRGLTGPGPAVVALWLPVPLTREQWTHLMTVLQAMKPGLVEPDDPNAPRARPPDRLATEDD